MEHQLNNLQEERCKDNLLPEERSALKKSPKMHWYNNKTSRQRIRGALSKDCIKEANRLINESVYYWKLSANPTSQFVDVSGVIIDSWKERLPCIFEKYSAKDTWNLDETGCFGELVLTTVLSSKQKNINVERGARRGCRGIHCQCCKWTWNNAHYSLEVREASVFNKESRIKSQIPVLLPPEKSMDDWRHSGWGSFEEHWEQVVILFFCLQIMQNVIQMSWSTSTQTLRLCCYQQISP